MSESCELCGRGMARKMITPTWWPYETVCERRGCQEATRDALKAVEETRDDYSNLVGAIRKRREAYGAPVGWRTDSMARIQFEEAWWANEVVKHI